MRIRLCVVGRLRAGPEKELLNDYLSRFQKLGAHQGFSKIEVIEVEDKTNTGKAAEAVVLENAIPKGAVRILLDERGKTVTSPEFAQKLAQYRDSGTKDLVFIIGGAEGVTPEFRASADFLLSFGKMVWPHMLVRVMLSEQLYRAQTIFSGSKYHKE